MRRYVMVRLTIAQAQAANACDLIRDEYEASGENKREAAQYKRASETIGKALNRG